MDMTRRGVATENLLQKNLSYYLDVRLEISTLRKRKLEKQVYSRENWKTP